ncbi:TSUP family transporter [Flavobacterium sp. SM15]|uniref:TSUP family transporter n=1 Tax=Flavobacterium sp. SM15 TaxID=2908005 RepID=UPI001EDB8D38|nr:TSUP family transporter [Flavobacterium sp. SM15]MCG2612354.1 TSUP family transporter [Flavobacterium sp. SM15]
MSNTLFPVFLKTETARFLIVGGGNVGLEKTETLLRQNPTVNIKLVATVISSKLKELLELNPHIDFYERPFEESDLNDADFVITATNDKVINSEIKRKANHLKLLVNAADQPDLCDFYLGSIVKKGHLKIAISTNGKSPTVSKRLREVLDENIPYEINDSLEHLEKLREHLKGDFNQKVDRLNEVTKVLVEKQEPAKRGRLKISNLRLWIYGFSIPALLITGYLLGQLISPVEIGNYGATLIHQADENLLWFILAGFVAQLIDGALGMAYGVTATSFLLSFGISPAVSSASVHASEVFTSGVSGLMHLKFGNVNSKLFKNLLIPGVIGAILGAYVLTSFEEYNNYIKPIVSIYTLILGIIIIRKALKKDKKRQKVKRLFPLAGVGGFLDSIGGGGWGPIVSTTLIANGKNPRYTIGSVNLAEFFVALASSFTFIATIGFTFWSVIIGLIIGGVIAAPIGALLANKIPTKALMILVGIVIIITSLKRILL